jgi:hypothetical protein
MADVWKADDEVINTMKDLIAKFHPHLAVCDDEIAVLFKEKASEVGDVVIAGKSAKAPALIAVLGEIKYKFVITLAADVWQDLDSKEKVALLDHHLCACRAVENPQTGESKFSLAPPDVAFYKGEIERHGLWRTSGAAPSATLMKEIFGDDKP